MLLCRMSAYTSVHMNGGTQRPEESNHSEVGVTDDCELSVWVLGIELGSSGRAECAVHCWVFCPSCWLSLTKPTDKIPAHLAFHDLHPCVLVTPCGFQTPRSPSLTQDWQTTSLVVLTCLVPLVANVGANVGTELCIRIFCQWLAFARDTVKENSLRLPHKECHSPCHHEC